ncbi:hypothetical protein HK102_011481, partial [Quaeritorhiza haematococci]
MSSGVGGKQQPVVQALWARFVVDEQGGYDATVGKGGSSGSSVHTRANTSSSSWPSSPVALASMPGSQTTATAPPHQERSLKALCIILRDAAKIIFEDGNSYTVNLPFVVKRAWALPVGILMQRMPDQEEIANAGNGSAIPVDNGSKTPGA